MNQNNFFRAAELLKLWAEIHDSTLTIYEVEIENEKELNVWLRIHGEEFRTKVKIDMEHGVIAAEPIKTIHYQFDKSKSFMVI